MSCTTAGTRWTTAPENLALPGVAWGYRWGRSAELKAMARSDDPRHADTDYVAMYWFDSPVADVVAARDRLGEASFQWGRGPLIPGVERNPLAFFRPMKGPVAPSALVSPEALPYRPNPGLHVTLTRHEDHHGASTHARHAWEDRVLIPTLLDVDGVAGAWTFSFSHHQQHTTLPFESSAEAAPGSLRVRLVYLEDEPAETTRRIDAAVADLADRREGG